MGWFLHLHNTLKKYREHPTRLTWDEENDPYRKVNIDKTLKRMRKALKKYREKHNV